LLFVIRYFAILGFMSCLFCKIVAGEIPAARVYEDDQLIALNDINPQAPMHVLVVPKRHVATLNDLSDADDALVGAMVRVAAKVAKDRGHDGQGFRTVFNCNAQAGQTVFHIHLHVLGGRNLAWPPG
jgi:histidine triad (HIT) family protein